MFGAIITTLIALFVSPGDADALRSTAPGYLTLDAAREHLAAATVAAVASGMDVNLLLSIAHHESRYDHTEQTSEAKGRVSCGVMTPTPQARCEHGMSVLSGYLDGAVHLRGWFLSTRTKRDALLGYGGGFAAITYCRTRHDGACAVPEVFDARRAMIRRARSRATRPSS